MSHGDSGCEDVNQEESEKGHCPGKSPSQGPTQGRCVCPREDITANAAKAGAGCGVGCVGFEVNEMMELEPQTSESRLSPSCGDRLDLCLEDKVTIIRMGVAFLELAGLNFTSN